MALFERFKQWLNRIFTPRFSVIALIVAPVAAALGAFLARVGVLACNSIHPTPQTNALVAHGVTLVLTVFVYATPILAILCAILVGLLLIELIARTLRRLRDLPSRDRHRGRPCNQSRGTPSANDATERNSQVINFRRREASF